jgi:5'-nucleotidase / UDP-sugar diphosphatase
VVDNGGTVLTPVDRVRSLVLDDGTVIVADGAVVAGPSVAVATNDLSARGGDQYPGAVTGAASGTNPGRP